MPLDPTSIGLAIVTLPKLAAGAIGKASEDYLGSKVRERLNTLKQRASQTSPGANHDLLTALAQSFWLSLLYITQSYGSRIDEPLTQLEKWGCPQSAVEAWQALRSFALPKGDPLQESDRPIVQRIYTFILAKVASEDIARSADFQAVYAEAEKLLLREPK